MHWGANMSLGVERQAINSKKMNKNNLQIGKILTSSQAIIFIGLVILVVVFS